MRSSELAQKAGLKALNTYTDRELEGVYISDMVSDIITGAKASCLLVTLQTHKSLIAAANLVDVAAIVFALADKAGIALFATDADTWKIASKLTELGMK